MFSPHLHNNIHSLLCCQLLRNGADKSGLHFVDLEKSVRTLYLFPKQEKLRRLDVCPTDCRLSSSLGPSLKPPLHHITNVLGGFKGDLGAHYAERRQALGQLCVGLLWLFSGAGGSPSLYCVFTRDARNSAFYGYTQRNLFEILLNQTEIRLFLPCTD